MANELLKDLQQEKNTAFETLYSQYFGMVSRFVYNNNGQAGDAEDLFQDTMMVLLKKLRKDDFVLTASLKTYFMAIAKNLWLKRLKTTYAKLVLSELDDTMLMDDIHQNIRNDTTYWEKLHSYLAKITSHCKGFIHDVFFREKTIEQIQREYGYSTKQKPRRFHF